MNTFASDTVVMKVFVFDTVLINVYPIQSNEYECI